MHIGNVLEDNLFETMGMYCYVPYGKNVGVWAGKNLDIRFHVVVGTFDEKNCSPKIFPLVRPHSLLACPTPFSEGFFKWESEPKIIFFTLKNIYCEAIVPAWPSTSTGLQNSCTYIKKLSQKFEI